MVSRNEWSTLRTVQEFHGYGQGVTLLCEVEPAHGMASGLLATPDNRAIALCHSCRSKQEREAAD